MRELALFAGAGGGILGGKLLGWRTVCAVERDPYAASVLVARQNDGTLDPFRSGMTCAHLTADHGEALLTSFRAAFRVRRTATPLEADTRREDCGQRCLELFQKYAQDTLFPKTRAKMQSSKLKQTLPPPVTLPRESNYQRPSWVLHILGIDGGWLPTPTTKANWGARSMQKWKGCRNAVKVFGKPTPENHEWLMGWPIGWTDLNALETDKCQQWLQEHGSF